MKRLFAATLIAGAALAHAQTQAQTPTAASTTVSPAKKELVQKLMALQQPIFENMARELVLRQAMQVGQAAGGVLQGMPAEKRESAAKAIDADIRSFIDESTPPLRERAVKLAPTTIGPILEEKMTEDDLRALVGWLESPAAKKYQQLGGELQHAMGQKLVAEAGPMLTPKLQALEKKVRATLGIPAAAASAPAKAAAPKKRASGQ